MARPLRIPVEDGWYHVFGRGLERRDIYAADRDREHFLELLGEMHARYRVIIHAYALLDNHYHCIFQTPDANLSEAMQWLHGSYSAWYNAKHDRVGPLFQGRFKAVAVENSGWAYALSLYVHLNPLRITGLGLDGQGRVLERCGFVRPSREQVTSRMKGLREYKWSSYRAYAGYVRPMVWLECSELLRRAHHRVADRQAQYRGHAKQKLVYGMDEGEAERLRDAVAIGGEAFARRIRGMVGDSALHGITDRRALRRRVSFGDVEAAVASLKGEPWQAAGSQRGDWGKPLFLWVARRLCGCTLREIGAAAGGMDEGAVGMALKRHEQRVSESSVLRKRQASVLQMLDVKP